MLNRASEARCDSASRRDAMPTRCFCSRKYSRHFSIAPAILATALFAPPAASAQECKILDSGGCQEEKAPCSPVNRGIGSSGQCKNTIKTPGEQECLCVGEPERPPPGPCGDRTATGKIECTIDKPVVTLSETPYRGIVFAPGDLVYVNADGCVQTGSHWWSGSTWKRYVNPSGKDSDHLYHGLVRIPTAKLAGTDVGNSLTRIKNVIGRLITVTGQGSPVSDLFLHLGYEDDDYSDNGYHDHDDGTEDQCRTDTAKGHDGGPAHVTITIYRGVSPDPPKSRYDFDVLSSEVDPNGFLLNPHWSWQDKPGNHGKIPMTEDMCHNFSKYDRLRRPGPNFPDCTDQAGLDSVDQPTEPNSTICDLYKEHAVLEPIFGFHPPFSGHVNWFPVTITG